MFLDLMFIVSQGQNNVTQQSLSSSGFLCCFSKANHTQLSSVVCSTAIKIPPSDASSEPGAPSSPNSSLSKPTGNYLLIVGD